MTMMEDMLYKFPAASESRATRWQRRSGSIRLWLGKLFNIIHLPGAMQNADIQDGLTGQNIRVRVGPLFTRLTVNGRDYYFSRWSGRYDGTGMGCS